MSGIVHSLSGAEAPGEAGRQGRVSLGSLGVGQAYLGGKWAVPLSQESRYLVGKGTSPRAGPRSLVQAGHFGVVLTEPLHTAHPRPCCFQEETAVSWD